MALAIKLSTFISGGYTNPVRWDLYEDRNGVSSVLVDSHTEPGPHGQEYNFAFTNNIKDVVYRIELYDVPAGAGVGNLIKSHVLTVSTSTLLFDIDIELIVNGGQTGDPVAGNTSVVIPQLHGRDFSLSQRGQGQLLAVRNPEYSWTDATNTLQLLSAGDTFVDGDVYIAKIRPKYVINPPGSQSGSSLFQAVEVVTADKTLTSLDFGKLFIVDIPVNTVATITLPTTIIDDVPIWIESVGTRLLNGDTNHNNVIIQHTAGNNIAALGRLSNTVILGRCEKIMLVSKLGVMYGFTESPDIKKAGQVDWNYGGANFMVNRLYAVGTEIVLADFPRIKKAMDDGQLGTVVNYTQWAATTNGGTTDNPIVKQPNRAKYALSNDGLKAKIPDLRGLILKYEDITINHSDRNTQNGGGMQFAQTGEVKVTAHKGENYSGNPYDSVLFGRGQTPQHQDTIMISNPGKESLVDNFANMPLIIT